MFKTQILSIIFCCLLGACVAQNKGRWNPEQKKVLQVVFDMFEGMRTADTTGFHQMFTPNARLLTVMDREAGKESLREDSLVQFFQAMSKPREVVYDEPLWDIEVQIDGRLAQVWTQYAFYVGDRFSHCGVDAFQLFNDSDGQWKIFQLVDTRHFGEENCDLPGKMYRSLSDF